MAYARGFKTEDSLGSRSLDRHATGRWETIVTDLIEALDSDSSQTTVHIGEHSMVEELSRRLEPRWPK